MANAIPGVLVDIWDRFLGNETKTDDQGRFRLSAQLRDKNGRKLPGGFSRHENLEVRFLKEGYSPVLILDRQAGTDDWNITMDSRTYFEGKVTGPDGKPVPNVLIRADQGPKSVKRGDRNGRSQRDYVIRTIWTETRSGPDGHYRLYVQADGYRIEARVPGVGVKRITTSIREHEEPSRSTSRWNAASRSERAIDTGTTKPVPNVWLHNWDYWRYKGIEGKSNDTGDIVIEDMLPGKFDFQVEATGYARWWSDQAASPQSRLVSWLAI